MTTQTPFYQGTYIIIELQCGELLYGDVVDSDERFIDLLADGPPRIKTCVPFEIIHDILCEDWSDED